MFGRLRQIFTAQAARGAARRWGRAAQAVPQLSAQQLEQLAAAARQERAALGDFLHHADAQLQAARLAPDPLLRLPGLEWAWRPDMWRGAVPDPAWAAVPSQTRLCPGLTLFHDCPLAQIATRQQRNTRADDVSPWGLQIDVMHFSGSFLSLVIDLPADAVQGLRSRHLIRLDPLISSEQPIEGFARLNIRQGPNVEQVVRELPATGAQMVEFDMFYSGLNEKRADSAWIDLIFQAPAHNQMLIRDLTLSRRPRAEL